MNSTIRFWAKVDKNGPIPIHGRELGRCWIWTGCRLQQKPYGRFRWDGSPTLAHRVSFFLAHGRWPEPHACHHCDNPSCVNPAHLFEGTHQDNVNDRENKGRNRPPRGEAHHAARLTEADILAIRADAAADDGPKYGRHARVARKHGVSRLLVGVIMRGEGWRHI